MVTASGEQGIHELREYLFLPERWPAYRRLLVDAARRVRGDRFGLLVGAWSTTDASGDIRFIHLWQYRSLDARTALRQELAQVAAWSSEFLAPAMPLIQSQTLSVLRPRSGADALAHYAAAGGDFHRASAFVGQAAQAAADVAGEGVCCWTTEFPDPNEIAWFAPSGSAQSRGEGIRSLRTLRLTPLDPTNPTLLV
ncbi:NIPSNAP family protein [Variovorax sp. tm]|uniref:NIPSNAP family protein n=1 Tax=Variovorax atrisoli TaxID=3394203 RepID=UPI003A80F452